MSAAITTTATNLPAQLLEVAGAVHSAELAIAADLRPDNITISVDPEGSTVSINATLPVTFTAAAGEISFTPTDYLDYLV